MKEVAGWLIQGDASTFTNMRQRMGLRAKKPKNELPWLGFWSAVSNSS